MSQQPCEELPYYPTFSDTFLTCPSMVYITLTSLNGVLVLSTVGIFLHLLYRARVERHREIPYLVSLPPICSTISLIELCNPSTVELLSAFRFVYLVFCILQFYQYIASYYGYWDDLMSLLPGFVFEAQICCGCCKFKKEITITRRRLNTNKALVYTGVISYIVMIMITVAFNTPPEVEGTLLSIGVVLFIVGIRAVRRFLALTQQFYPEIAGVIRGRWAAVRLCFVVVGLQGFVLRLFSALDIIPPLGIFNSSVMVDIVHNMLVPVELCFAMILAHRAFSGGHHHLVEETPLLPKLQRGNTGSQTDVLADTYPRGDSGVGSTDMIPLTAYGSLSQEMRHHVEQAIEESWRKSNPDLHRGIGQGYMGATRADRDAGGNDKRNYTGNDRENYRSTRANDRQSLPDNFGESYSYAVL